MRVSIIIRRNSDYYQAKSLTVLAYNPLTDSTIAFWKLSPGTTADRTSSKFSSADVEYNIASYMYAYIRILVSNVTFCAREYMSAVVETLS